MLTATNRELNALGEALFYYEPLPAPYYFHWSKAKNRWILGGNRSGKSESCIGYDLCSFALGVHPVRELPYYEPPDHPIIWAAADTWSLVGKLLWQEKIREYMPASEIEQIVWRNRQEEIPTELRLTRSLKEGP